MSLKKFKILANNYTNKNELNIGKNIKYYSVNKIGYVFKENVLLKKSEIYDLQAKLKNSVYNDVKNDIKEIYSLLHITYEEIYDLIQIENSLNISNNLSIEIFIDNLSYEIIKHLNLLASKIYRKFLVELSENEDFCNNKEAKEIFKSFKLPDNEIYDRIKIWVYNLKTWILDNINLIFEEKQVNINKDFFSDIKNSIEDIFDRVKTKIENFISYTISAIKTKAGQIILNIHGIEKYEIITSGQTNCCEHCQNMSGEIYDVDNLKIGETVPPFHPNCDCQIKGRRTIANIDEPMILSEYLENYDRELAIDYAINWYDKYNTNYPNFSAKGDCANFVSQCLEAGGFKMNEYWHCYLKNPREVNPFYHLIDQFNNWNYTLAWAVAKEQYEYLKSSNIVTEETILNSAKDIAAAINDTEIPVKIGDIMYLKWDKEYPHHATIISKIENNMIYYTAHTDSYNKKPLSEFFNDNKNGVAYILKIK